MILKKSNRIMDIKYQRILWLNKRIRELKEKIRLKKLGCIVLAVLLSSCAIPIKLTTYTSQEDILRQEKIRLEEGTKKETTEVHERELILQSFNDSGIILKAFEKLGCSLFDMAGFLNEYGKFDMDGFCDFLAEKYPFNTVQRWAVDKEIFTPAKRNYELILQRLNEK